MPPMPKVNLKGLADFLSKNTLALIFMFVLLLAMIVMQTQVTIFGFDFGFKSAASPCIPEIPIAKPAEVAK